MTGSDQDESSPLRSFSMKVAIASNLRESRLRVRTRRLTESTETWVLSHSFFAKMREKDERGIERGKGEEEGREKERDLLDVEMLGSE